MRSWTRDPVTLAVTTLATHRLTRLLTVDQLPGLADARSRVEEVLLARAPRWAPLVRCPWCVSVYVAAAMVVATQIAQRRGRLRGWLLVMLPWALSTVTGLLADLEPT